MIEKKSSSTKIFLEKHQSIFSSFFSITKKNNFLKLCEALSLDDKVIYVCCSWWPDSMFLTFLIIWYRHIVKWQSLSITKILHINHNTSREDFLMENLVTHTFGSAFEIKKLCLPNHTYTETQLRKQRRKFYTNCIQSDDSLQCVYLCLWHNLNDRIENSFLHIDRGARLPGIINMKQKQKKYIYGEWLWKRITYTCVRPLLGIEKKVITKWCDQTSIPYLHDRHNFDFTQKRVQYRYMINGLSWMQEKQFYKERKYVYNTLEKDREDDYLLTNIQAPTFRDISSLYMCSPPINLKNMVTLFRTIWAFTNMSASRLHELMKWFLKKKWAMYMNWWWFLFWWGKEGRLFLAQQKIKNKFWEHIPEMEQLIEKKKEYTIDIYTGIVCEQDYIGWVVTFPRKGDMFWSKTFVKRASKQHIPFFRRRALPIIKKNDRIVGVLPLLSYPWKA